jgi:hypothetical protein
MCMQPKILIALFTCLFFTNSFAQFAKGTRMAGAAIGSAVFSSGNTDYSGESQFPSTVSNNSISIGVAPLLGWFLNEHTVVGGSLLFNYSKQKFRRIISGTTDKKDNIRNTDVGIGAFARYYFGKSTSLKPFAHIYLNAGSGTTKTDGVYYSTSGGFTDKSSYNGKSTGRFFYNTGINAGVTKMINTYTGLDAFIGYGLSHTQFTTNTTQVVDYGNTATPDSRSQYELKQNFTGNAINMGIGLQIFIPSHK